MKLLPALTALALTSSVALGQATHRVSIDSNQLEASGRSTAPAISADGRYVAFESTANDLVGNDTNNASDIFVRDRVTGRTIRVSVAGNGDQANGSSFSPSISGDGRYVAFLSTSTNLVPDDTNGRFDIFRRDLLRHRTERASVDSNGLEGNGDSLAPSISASGRLVAFVSEAVLAPGTGGGSQSALHAGFDMFVHDFRTRQTTVGSVSSGGLESNGENLEAVISGDGRFVAWVSEADNLVSDDFNGFFDVFVHDLAAGDTVRMSLDSVGDESTGHAINPAISGDGGTVAFATAANGLVPGDDNGLFDIYVRDRLTGALVRASRGLNGAQPNGSCFNPKLSGDGQRVVYRSNASNLVPGDTNGSADIFLFDRTTGVTTRISVDSAGAQGSGSSFLPAISADGTEVAFQSDSHDLVTPDGNGLPDVFVREP